MSEKTISDLRAALFDALQKVKDGSMDLDKARAVNELGKTLIDSAKVEVDYLRTTGGDESSFIASAAERPSSIGSPHSGLPRRCGSCSRRTSMLPRRARVGGCSMRRVACSA